MLSSKPDCVCAIQRKAETATLFTVEQSVLSSPVCRGRIAKYGHVSHISREMEVGILCSPDCVAERKGFEPSAQVWHAKPRGVRKLQIAKAHQRISHQNPTSEFATSPVLIRHPFEAEQRTQGDSSPKMVTLRASESLIRFARDCLPSGQSQNLSFSPAERMT
jgi:hypothetical protein